MLTRLYDYVLLPEQLNILFEDYSVFTDEVIDSYIYICDVCSDGIIKKREFICVHIQKNGKPTIYSNSMDFGELMAKCISKKTIEPVSMKKKNR
jgi:hypothetical protein